MIELREVKKKYQVGRAELWALKGVSLKINQGEFVAFQGPSGSGKTTLLNIVGLLDVPTGGEYLFDGKNVGAGSHKERARYRAQYLGFIFQTFNLIPELTVYENVEIPLLIMGEKPAVRKKKVERIVEAVGLESHIKHRPGELSGGQMQRVAIARALVKNPPVVIADEPTANLDTKTGREIVELMKRLNKEYGTTFLFATHDENIIGFMERVFNIVDGSIVHVSGDSANS
ncbi:MAG: ABC transporter ATP-binding protein [Firmicutes bacterium]|jgi:putative ABC transport system ATP-binding protein|nr:ABC transporter ATP-binding protein [Bacillota bacterium]